jgi:hypothetical protein
MADPSQFFEDDSDSDSAYPVHHHNKPHFQTRAGTMADAFKYLEYDSDSDDLVHHHNKPQFMTSENNWLLKYQQFFHRQWQLLLIGFCTKELNSNLILIIMIPAAFTC